MTIGLRLRRLLWLIPLGILLALIAGYIGGIAIAPVIAVWVALMFLKLITMQFGAFFEVMAAPALYGAQWAWPVTCVLLPLASLLVRRAGRSTPWMFLVIAAVAGAMSAYFGTLNGDFGLKPAEAHWFGFAGGFAGAVTGMIFGFALRRIDNRQAALAS